MTYEALQEKMALRMNEIRLYKKDFEVLSKYAALVESPNWCVDIGTYMGGSAEIMMLSSKPDVKIYTVDQREMVSKEFQERNKDKIRFDFIDSRHAGSLWNKPVGMLFIDGDHYNARKDFDAWEKHVIQGGYVLFHDFHPAIPLSVRDALDVLNIDSNSKYKLLYMPDLGKIWDNYVRGVGQDMTDETVIMQLQKL